MVEYFIHIVRQLTKVRQACINYPKFTPPDSWRHPQMSAPDFVNIPCCVCENYVAPSKRVFEVDWTKYEFWYFTCYGTPSQIWRFVYLHMLWIESSSTILTDFRFANHFSSNCITFIFGPSHSHVSIHSLHQLRHFDKLAEIFVAFVYRDW